MFNESERPTPDEEWRPIAGWEGLYEVSNHGRMRSLTRTVRCGRNATRTVPGQILKLRPGKSGYLRGNLSQRSKHKDVYAHRAVALTFIGPPEPKQEVRHWDNDKTNNRVDNLRWGTHRENEADKARHGTHSQLNKTHCPRNHPLEEPNLSPAALKKDRRHCLACHRASGYYRVTDRRFDAEADRQYRRIVRTP